MIFRALLIAVALASSATAADRLWPLYIEPIEASLSEFVAGEPDFSNRGDVVVAYLLAIDAMRKSTATGPLPRGIRLEHHSLYWDVNLDGNFTASGKWRMSEIKFWKWDSLNGRKVGYDSDLILFASICEEDLDYDDKYASLLCRKARFKILDYYRRPH